MDESNSRKGGVKPAVGGLAWGAILLAWSGYIAWLFSRGSLNTYLHPRMTPFAIGAMIGFAVLGIVALFRALAGKGPALPKLGFALFVIPVALASAAGPRALSEAAAGQRVMKAGTPKAASFESVGEYLATLDPSEPIVFQDWSHAALIEAIASDPAAFAGREVELVGFAYRPAGTPRNRLYLIRFLVTCCVADAEPMGLLVEGTATVDYQDFAWLKAAGRLESAEVPNPYTGKRETVALLRLARAEPSPKPLAEYLFPGQL
jgi:uncharacterized repeat protein (TIGR03943 family)